MTFRPQLILPRAWHHPFFVSHPSSSITAEGSQLLLRPQRHVASRQLRFRYARRARFVVITVLTVVATAAVDDDPPVLRLLIGSLARARNARLYADSGT